MVYLIIIKEYLYIIIFFISIIQYIIKYLYLMIIYYISKNLYIKLIIYIIIW